MKFNKYLIVVAAGLALATLAAWSYLKFRQPKARLVVSTCLQNADGLRTGARVRIAGVDVGSREWFVRSPEIVLVPPW